MITIKNKAFFAAVVLAVTQRFSLQRCVTTQITAVEETKYIIDIHKY